MTRSVKVADRDGDTIEVEGTFKTQDDPLGLDRTFITVSDRGGDCLSVLLTKEQLYEVYVAIGQCLQEADGPCTTATGKVDWAKEARQKDLDGTEQLLNTQANAARIAESIAQCRRTGGNQSNAEFLAAGGDEYEKSRSVTVISTVGELTETTIHTVKYK